MCGNYQNTQPLVTRRKCTKFWQKSPESLCGQNQEWKVFAVNLFLNTKCPLLWTLRILFAKDWQYEIYCDYPKTVTHTQNCEVRWPRPLPSHRNFDCILDFLASDMMRKSLRPWFVHTSHTEFLNRMCDRWTRRVWLAETEKTRKLLGRCQF